MCTVAVAVAVLYDICTCPEQELKVLYEWEEGYTIVYKVAKGLDWSGLTSHIVDSTANPALKPTRRRAKTTRVGNLKGLLEGHKREKRPSIQSSNKS
jgi:hypothetical protein